MARPLGTHRALTQPIYQLIRQYFSTSQRSSTHVFMLNFSPARGEPGQYRRAVGSLGWGLLTNPTLTPAPDAGAATAAVPGNPVRAGGQ